MPQRTKHNQIEQEQTLEREREGERERERERERDREREGGGGGGNTMGNTTGYQPTIHLQHKPPASPERTGPRMNPLPHS